VLCDYVTLLVVDEVHLVDEAPDGRGALINSMISISLFFSLNNENSLQIVAMSATLPNLEYLGSWLKAQVFETNERTSTLTELLFCNSRMWELKHQHHKVKIKNLNSDLYSKFQFIYQGCCKSASDKYASEIYKQGFCCSCCFFEPIHVPMSNLSQSDSSPFFNIFKKEEIYIVQLLVKNYQEKRSTILFGKSKRQVEIYAERLINGILNLINPHPSDAQKNLHDKLLNCQAAYSASKASCQMAKFVLFGIAYHHSGLSLQERSLLEAAFW
jgi:replicative superfamily II helicase